MARSKSKKPHARFAGIPHSVLYSEAYSQLGGWEVKLLLDLVVQYNGYNNGDLTTAYSLLKERGWRSPGTLQKAKKRLLELDFIQESRMGGRNRCSLYAVTWVNVDECKGKLDIAHTNQPVKLWKAKN
jgi:hypothetical protein